MHLYYPSVYQNLSGCIRDISGDREFSYVSATEYSMQVFDRVNDSRFWKSFITTYNCNSSKGAPAYTDEDAAYLPSGKAVRDKRFKGGEIGVKYIVNNPGIRHADGEPEAVSGKRVQDKAVGRLQPPSAHKDRRRAV